MAVKFKIKKLGFLCRKKPITLTFFLKAYIQKKAPSQELLCYATLLINSFSKIPSTIFSTCSICSFTSSLSSICSIS